MTGCVLQYKVTTNFQLTFMDQDQSSYRVMSPIPIRETLCVSMSSIKVKKGGVVLSYREPLWNNSALWS